MIWLGPLVAVCGLVSYFTVIPLYPDLRDRALLNLLLVCLGVGLSIRGAARAFSSMSLRRTKMLGALGAVFSMGCAGLLFSYVFFISSDIPEPQANTLAMEVIPQITLTDQAGNEVSLHKRDGRSLVLTFYRGHW